MGNKNNQDLQLLAKCLPVCPFDNEYIERGKCNSGSSLKRSITFSKKKVGEKSVRFSKKRHVRKIPHVNNLSDKIIKDCWFGPKCFEEFKVSYQRLLYLMETGAHAIDEENESTRGLENRSPGRAWEKYQRKQYAFDAVMDEQDRQWRKDIEDPHIIAQLYQKANKESTQIAIVNAKQDEIAIQEYVGNMRMEELKRKLILPDSFCMRKSMKYSVGTSN